VLGGPIVHSKFMVIVCIQKGSSDVDFLCLGRNSSHDLTVISETVSR
jgi:hypothetical protein